MKKMLFVMNPVSGQKRANRYFLDIVSLFNRAGYEVSVHVTGGQGDARQVVANRAREMDLVVCCGGDGTLNETISGLLQSYTDVPVGYIPAGSTNDFASSLKLPGSILQAAQTIIEGEPVPYDVGKFGSRYFSYVASFGAFTRTSYVTPQNVKNALGHTAYVLSGIQELSQIRREHIRIEVEDYVIEDDFLFGAICNSTSVGGILTLDPKQVDMGDGLMELLLVRMPRNLTEITECIQAVQAGRYNDCDMITFGSARKMTIYADPDMPWTLDGEREEGHSEVTVENLHHAIRLMQKVEKG
ncbi:MAG: diacylglycerol kinase family lipid kinase [Oscillospiraceae bacterium]|nr:diacylglycerol kinase family lipid kinase [Oscillospiraceae bacterium]